MRFDRFDHFVSVSGFITLGLAAAPITTVIAIATAATIALTIVVRALPIIPLSISRAAARASAVPFVLTTPVGVFLSRLLLLVRTK